MFWTGNTYIVSLIEKTPKGKNSSPTHPVPLSSPSEVNGAVNFSHSFLEIIYKKMSIEYMYISF